MSFRLSSSFETTVSTAAFVAAAALTTVTADGQRLHIIEAGHGADEGVGAESHSHEEISQSLLLENKTRLTDKKSPSADSDNTLPNDIDVDVDVGVLQIGFVGVAEDGDKPVNPSIEFRNSRSLASYDCSLCGDSRPLLSADTNMQDLIADCESANFVVGDDCPSKVECFDTSLVTNTSDAFWGSSFRGDLNCWDVSSVLEMRSMFQEAYNFNGGIPDWDVSSVSDMSRMFYFAGNFNQDLEEWDVSGVFYMERMFQGTPEVTADFDQCLATWAEKTPTYVNTFKMFEYTMCPYQPDNPDDEVGPWCQGLVGQGCGAIAATDAPIAATDAPIAATEAPIVSSISRSSKSSKKTSKIGSSSSSTKRTKNSKKSKSSSS